MFTLAQHAVLTQVIGSADGNHMLHKFYLKASQYELGRKQGYWSCLIIQISFEHLCSLLI